MSAGSTPEPDRMPITTMLKRASLLLPVIAAPLAAQVPDTTKAVPPKPPAAEVSGVIFTTYRYGGDADSRSDNRFDVDRAYITVRAPAGDRVAIRVTADVFQQRDSDSDDYYRGWTFRAKYAYADWKAGSMATLPITVRLGMMQTTVIEHEETFWNRGLSSTAVEQSGFFSSADVGAGAIATLPNRLGEVFVAAYNGNGYTSRETDRFKDVGARITVTPFANGAGWLKTLAISPWVYVGARASEFEEGAGTVTPVAESRRKNRFGVFTGIREPGVIAGVHFGRKADDVEDADTLSDLEPIVTNVKGNLVSAFTIVKPGLLGLPLPSPLLAVVRHDFFKPDADADGFQRFLIAGLGWQLTSKATVYLDWQRRTAGDGASDVNDSIFFVHGILSY